MKKISPFFTFSLTLLLVSITSAQTSAWQKPYAGADAAGTDVMALWHFDAANPGADASGNKHTLQLRGKDSHFVADGKFGGGLLVESKVEPGDSRQGAALETPKALNPSGAFTMELWFSPAEEAAKQKRVFLIDKHNYFYRSDIPRANTGYLLLLQPSKNGKFTVQAQLGFGKDSVVLNSVPQTFAAGEWYHLAFTYDGRGGYHFYLGNTNIGSGQLENRGAIAPSNYPLVIGDRVGSSGYRFYGRIDEVRLLNAAQRFASGKVLLSSDGQRTVFYRMEKNANMRMRVFNDTFKPLQAATVHINIIGVLDKTLPLPELAAGESTFISVPLDTSLRPASYQVNATVQNARHQALGDETQFPLIIMPRQLPHQMPLVLWGNINDDKDVADVGYTGVLVGGMAGGKQIWDDGSREGALTDLQAKAVRERLDSMMALRLGGLGTFNPAKYVSQAHPEFNQTDKEGKKGDHTDGLYPRVQQFASDFGAAVAKTFGDMPNWKGALLSGEFRSGHTAPSFNEIDEKAFREYSGKDIPSNIGGQRGVHYKTLPGFPANRIIPDDNPLLQYYKWFWSVGDGWNHLNTLVDQGLKSTGRDDIFTWADPAVRAPGVWGNGGNVDYLNQWTYSYPNPIDVGLAADELFAMAKGRPGQKVMNMIQIIWYRNKTTGTPQKGQETEWEKVSPDARFISIAPDHLSEGTWLEFARPVSAIANHGWGCLGDHLGFSSASGAYVTTNTGTRKRMSYLFHNVIKPLAPTLLQVPGYDTKVAFLESFASQIFAGRGTYGWGGGWGADSYMIAQYAGLQPRIIYDQTIQKDGLDQYNVLFLTDCDVLTQSVADAIKKFQQKGGIVIGDEDLAPGIQPDILLKKITRSAPDVTKPQLIAAAQELVKNLQPFYQRPLQSSNPDVLTRLRPFGDSRYVFTINDHRTYGNYVGQYKRVMEKGLPSSAQITVNAMPSGAVYDLMHHRQVPTTKILGKVQFPVDLKAGEGDVFLVTPKPVGKLSISAPAVVQTGKSINIKVLLSDVTGKPLDAVAPLEVTIRDSKGRIAEKSGYYGAANGQLNLTIDIATNDTPGKWQIEVTEALTGQKVVRDFVVK